MNKNTVLSGLLASVLMLSLSVPVFATNIETAGGTSAVPVPLTAEAATFSVTVPTQLPINVDASGVVTTATEVKITNNSHGSVKVTNVAVAGTNSWATVDYDSANMSAEKVGSKKVAMTINGDKTTGADTLSFTATNFPKMDGKNDTNTDELPITYAAKVPAQATALASVSVANVTFTVAWDE